MCYCAFIARFCLAPYHLVPPPGRGDGGGFHAHLRRARARASGAPEAQVAAEPVEVSSGDSSGEDDSEATAEGTGDFSPSCKADLLHALPDDDDTNDHPVKEVATPAGVVTRSKLTLSKKPPAGVPTKSRLALISRGGTSASTPPDVVAVSADTALFALEACVPVAQAAGPLGSMVLKRPRGFAAVDQ